MAELGKIIALTRVFGSKTAATLATPEVGINQWDEEWEVGGINDYGLNNNYSNRIRSKNYIRVIPNATYYIKVPTGFNLYTFYYDADKNFISSSGNNHYENRTITLESNMHYIRFYLWKAGWTDYSYNNDISINYPSTDHDYHEYNGGALNIKNLVFALDDDDE